MKKFINQWLILGLFAFSLMLTGCKSNSSSSSEDEWPVKFAVISDIHYYDPSLGTSGSAFEQYLLQDRKMLRESKAILTAAVNELKNSGVKFVLVPGDLTKDGEVLNHQKVASYFQQLEDAGIEVWVIPGNHDLNNSHALRYLDNSTEPVPSATPEDFISIYHQFGYDQALDRDPNSLSYLAEPAPNVWLIAIDSCRYEENQPGQDPITGGRIKPETLAWILDKVRQGREQGKIVIAMMHHGILEHFRGQATFDQTKDYVVQDYQTISKELSKAGLEVVFTGHFHATDITEQSWQEENQSYKLIDVETGSLVTYPVPIRYLTLDQNKTLSITTTRIAHIDYPLPANETFQQYAYDYVYNGLVGLSNYIFTTKYHLTPEQTNFLAPLTASAFIAHYQGDEHIDPTTNATLMSLVQSENPLTAGLGQELLSLWTDLYPADNVWTTTLD